MLKDWEFANQLDSYESYELFSAEMFSELHNSSVLSSNADLSRKWSSFSIYLTLDWDSVQHPIHA